MEKATASSPPLSPGQERMPSVRPSRALSTEGQFGVITSNGQLLCEFKTAEGEAPAIATPEDKTASPPPTNEPEPRISRKPVSQSAQATSLMEISPDSRTSSTLMPAVDHDSYPEVYVPAAEDSHPTPVMDQGTPSPPYSEIAGGYVENNGMNPHAVPTVTPIYLLGDQPDFVDCPFCLKRVETKVVKKASKKTQSVYFSLLSYLQSFEANHNRQLLGHWALFYYLVWRSISLSLPLVQRF